MYIYVLRFLIMTISVTVAMVAEAEEEEGRKENVKGI